ncbi:MAG: cytochrome-c peroxidase, partial [Cytophagaceae bacterium]|nr:cytochrome-c peroxidase [Cytophagaceae bacterium]
FQAKGCASCHAGELITDGTFRYNGLQPTQINDLGRAKITELAADNYKFKVPSLRNIEVTRPYMHDGRFFDLEMVLNHYTERVLDGPTLDPIFRQNSKPGIALTDVEKKQLVAFLKTLTDRKFLTNPKFAEPPTR